MNASTVSTASASRTRSLAFVGLTIAIMAVSAWVTVPLGPVPFTLQMFAITFAVVVLSPKESIAAIYGYVLLGAVGVPVFSGMRGGIGVLAGPTGGFLWGYLIGVPLAALLLWAARRRFKRTFGFEVLAGVVFTLCAYACGCLQYMLLTGVSLQAAILTSVAPFIVVDVLKILAAVVCARAVRAAVK